MSEDKNNAVDDLYKATGDVANALTKVFLAGVGVVATTADKSKEVADKLVKRGEQSIARGKAANEELTKKATAAAGKTTDHMLQSYLESLTPEERAAFVAHVKDVAEKFDEQAAEAGVAADQAAEEVSVEAEEASER
jgi:polyhydroxyalkanoate synthesis regulator phasin